MIEPTEPLSEAKQTLLRALDSIEEIEQDMETEVRHVCVAYSVWKGENGVIRDQGGWNHSDAPAWLIAGMLRHTAAAIEASVSDADEED